MWYKHEYNQKWLSSDMMNNDQLIELTINNDQSWTAGYKWQENMDPINWWSYPKGNSDLRGNKWSFHGTQLDMPNITLYRCNFRTEHYPARFSKHQSGNQSAPCQQWTSPSPSSHFRAPASAAAACWSTCLASENSTWFDSTEILRGLWAHYANTPGSTMVQPGNRWWYWSVLLQQLLTTAIHIIRKPCRTVNNNGLCQQQYTHQFDGLMLIKPWFSPCGS